MKQYVKVYFQSKGDTEWTDFAFVLITGIIAYHGISYRDFEGERELVHLPFGWIALLYGIWVLGQDILGVLYSYTDEIVKKPCHFEQSKKSCIGKNYNIIKISPYGQNNKVDSSFLL